MKAENLQSPIFPFIWALIKPHKTKMLVGIIALISVNMLLLTVPMIIARIIDTYTMHNVHGRIDISRVVYLAMILLAISLVVFGLRILWRYFLIIPSYTIKKTNKEHLFTHILSLSPKSLRNYSVGEQISLISRETEQLSHAISWGTLALADGLITIIGVYIILLISYKEMAWASLLAYPLTIVFVYTIWNRIGKAYMNIQEHIASMSELTREMLQNIATIKSFNTETYYITRFLKKGNLIVKANMYISLLEGMLWPLLTVINSVAIILAIYLSITQIKLGNASIGDLSAVLNYLIQVQMPFMGLSFALDIQQKGMSNARRIRKILHTHTTLLPPKNPVDIQSKKGVLKIKGVVFSYPEPDKNTEKNTIQTTQQSSNKKNTSSIVNSNILTENNFSPFTLGPISMTINPGTWLGITGKIGCGKSTLANLLARLYNINQGSIEYDGTSIDNISLKKLRSTILLQTQQFQLFSWTVAQNILFDGNNLTETQMHTAIKYGEKAGLKSDVALFSKHWNTQIGEAGILLSGGQKQRVALSRSLVVDAPILVLDDIFSGLDYKTALQVISELKKIRKQKTTILISHNLAILRNADTIVIMDEGKIVEEGTHQTLLTNPNSLYTQSWHEYLITQGQTFEQ